MPREGVTVGYSSPAMGTDNFPARCLRAFLFRQPMNIAMNKLLAAALLCSAATTPALAQSTRYYGAADYGMASVSGSGATSPGALTVSAGYRYQNNLNFEAGFTQLGTIAADAPGNRVSVSESILSAVAVGILPVNSDVTVFGKAGVGLHNGEVQGLPDDMVYGFGGQFQINPKFSVRMQYENLGRVKIPTTNNKADVSRLSFGVVANF